MNINKNKIAMVTTFIPTTCTSNFGLLSNMPSFHDLPSRLWVINYTKESRKKKKKRNNVGHVSNMKITCTPKSPIRVGENLAWK